MRVERKNTSKRKTLLTQNYTVAMLLSFVLSQSARKGEKSSLDFETVHEDWVKPGLPLTHHVFLFLFSSCSCDGFATPAPVQGGEGKAQTRPRGAPRRRGICGVLNSATVIWCTVLWGLACSPPRDLEAGDVGAAKVQIPRDTFL